MNGGLQRWAEEQRRLCDQLGLSVEAWVELLEGAAERRAGLMAAVVGASVAAGQGMKPITDLDTEALLGLARGLLLTPPTRLRHPVLAVATQQQELIEGRGAARLKAARTPPLPPGAGEPRRVAQSPAPSATQATPDAPGAPRA